VDDEERRAQPLGCRPHPRNTVEYAARSARWTRDLGNERVLVHLGNHVGACRKGGVLGRHYRQVGRQCRKQPNRRDLDRRRVECQGRCREYEASQVGLALDRAGHKEEGLRRIEEALRMLTRRLAAAGTVAKGRQQALEARVRALRAKQGDLNERLKEFTGPEDAMRLYPIVAGALTLTALFRLRRILALRRALAGVDLDLVALSWVVASPSSPGRWWALLLIASPLGATIHAAAAALADRGLFVTVLGDPSQAMMVGYAVVYTALILVGIGQLLAVTRGLMVAPRKH
jgi:hypothetical protein